MNKMGPVWYLLSLCVSIALIALWQGIADARLVPPAFLPGPDRAWAALVEGVVHGDLLSKLIATVQRMIYGWLLASIVGIAPGAAIGISPAIWPHPLPTPDIIRPLPPP